MGWGSGSAIFGEIISSLQENIPDKDVRKKIYQDIYGAFANADWDTEDECLGEDPAFDEVYYEDFLSRHGYDPRDENEEDEDDSYAEDD